MPPKSNRKDNYSFTNSVQQQMMKAWQPVPTMTFAIVSFIIIGVIFLFLGIFIIVLSRHTTEISFRYDDLCDPETLCSVQVTFQENISQPIYFYYELDSFYQNYRSYFKSKSREQLLGNYLAAEDLEDCKPAIYNKDIPTKYSITGAALDPNQPAFPCGLIARSFFNDTFRIYKDGSKVSIKETGITWENGENQIYKNLDESQKNLQWLDIEDEHFIVWMRVSPLSGFKKLWGIIEEDIKNGTYTVEILNSKPLGFSFRLSFWLK